MMGGRIFIPILMTVFAAAFVVAPAAHAQGWDPREEVEEKSKLHRKTNEAIDAFLTSDPTLAIFFEQAYGYAVFPSVTKGGAGLGGARGKGILFRAGAPAMKAYVTQITIGLQLGGKKYREIVFFRDQAGYDSFVDGSLEFSAQATAVVASDGAGETASYDEGVAIFVLDKAGAMAEASIGGQKFKVKPLK